MIYVDYNAQSSESYISFYILYFVKAPEGDFVSCQYAGKLSIGHLLFRFSVSHK